MKKIIALLLVLAMALTLAACGNKPAENPTEAPVENLEGATIKVAAIETAYGSEVWQKVAEAFTAETGIKVELTTDKNLEDVISAPMQNGEFPDVVHLATGRPAGLTEQLVKQNALHPLTNTLSLTIPGESVKVADKIAGGFTDNNIVAPYGDGVTYMAPMFYSPCGLFYNAKLFEDKGWEVPTTWDEMWALGDAAAAEGIALFTYPTAGYYDAFMFALMNAIGGPEFFNAITTYEEGAWDTENGKTLSVAESCTGGTISALMTSVPGSSGYYLGSVTSYSNIVKTEVLGVPADIIERHGAVSSECVAAMAEGVRELTGSDYSVATSGIAGPGGGSEDKPVGLVWIGVSSERGTETFSMRFRHDRKRNIERFAASALNILRVKLVNELTH